MTKQQTIFTGKRKSAVARIRIKAGSGKFHVNGMEHKEYFKRKSVALTASLPLTATNYTDKIDIEAKVSGGGLSGQAGAVQMAIAKALNVEYPNLRAVLKPHGYLTRDDRRVQRKMYGHKKARKSFQFSKR